MADQQTIVEEKAMTTADATGLTDLYAYSNKPDLVEPLYRPEEDPLSDPIVKEALSRGGITKEKLSEGGIPAGFEPEQIMEFEDEPEPEPEREQFTADRKQNMYERIFGYDPAEDLPWGYEKMTPMQREVLKAQLAVQNVATRIGLGAEKQLAGTLQLLLPENVEEYLISDKSIKEGRLPEDRYYEARQQRELREKQETVGLSEEESEQLAYLDASMPSKLQRTPEFIGGIAAEIERAALAYHVFQSIKVPGVGSLNDKLSESGRKILGKPITALANKAGNSPVLKTGLTALSEQMTKLGPAVGELFTWGVISEEVKEDGTLTEVAIERTEAGVKMSAWALLPVVLVPGGKSLAKTRTGAITGEYLQRVAAKVTSPIADKLATMGANRAKAKFVNQAVVEADEIFKAENGRGLTSAEKKVVKETFNETAEQVSKIVKKDAKTITAKMEELSARQTGSTTVGIESVVPKQLRVVETVGDDVINSTNLTVEAKTPYASVRQPNGNYAILDKETFQEIAVDVKRKDLANRLDDLIFGGEKAPVKNKVGLPKRKATKITISEEKELKRSLARMEKATNTAYRAGAKEGAAAATERANIKIQAGKERLATIKAGNQKQWENVEYARQLVKEFVPKEEQGLFLNRIIKARTEGGMQTILDDIEKNINRASVRNSVASLKDTMKSLKSKYGDKSGEFAKAPDEIRPVLETLSKVSSSINKTTQKAGADLDDLGGLAESMIAGINSALQGKGEVFGLPKTLTDDLYGLVGKEADTVTADTIETLSQLARIVVHRAEQSQMIQLEGQVMAASKAIDDSIGRIIPRKLTPKVQSQKARFKDLFGVESDHPITLIEKMFGEGSDMSVLLDDLYEGEIQAFGIMRNSYAMAKQYMLDNKISDDAFTNLKKKMNVTIDGKSIELTRDDALGLVMSTRDPWLFDQITKTRGFDIGGFRVGRASIDELSDIASKLTPEEMKLGAMFFNLNDNYLAQIVNERSLQLNGVKMATYPQYYPGHRKLDIAIHGNKFGVSTAETKSVFLPRMGGKGTLKFNAYSRELMDYIQNASMYNGTATQMRSLKTVLSDKRLQKNLQESGYGKELKNFADIISRSEGMRTDNSVLDLIGSDILNKFTKGILGGRISTIGTQMASVPAAKSVIPSKYFKATDTLPGTDAIDDLMSSDFFWHRWTGRRVSVELGDSASKSSLSHFISDKTPLSEKPLSGLVWGDKQAAGKIYLAAERFVKDTTKFTGNEAKEAAIKLTEKAFRETQPNWSVLTRSKLASDPSTFKRSMTMFRTAQEAQLNIIKRANSQFARSAKSSKDVAKLKDSYRAVFESQMSVALWKTLWKRGKNAGIAGVAGWLGVHTPQNEKPFAEDLVRNAARTVAGTVPLGQLIESTVESSVDQLMGEGGYINTSQDPITTVMSVSQEAVSSISKWANKYIESNSKREGFTADFSSVTLDDLLDDISTSKADREQKKAELVNQVQKDVVKAIRAAGLITGLPVAPIDEWISPGLKRSPFAQVGKINDRNSSDPADMQRDLHKFLTKQKELKKKEEEKGLTKEEAKLLFNMNLLKKSRIDAFFAIAENATDRSRFVSNGKVVKPLDDISRHLKEFNKKNIQD